MREIAQYNVEAKLLELIEFPYTIGAAYIMYLGRVVNVDYAMEETGRIATSEPTDWFAHFVAILADLPGFLARHPEVVHLEAEDWWFPLDEIITSWGFERPDEMFAMTPPLQNIPWARVLKLSAEISVFRMRSDHDAYIRAIKALLPVLPQMDDLEALKFAEAVDSGNFPSTLDFLLAIREILHNRPAEILVDIDDSIRGQKLLAEYKKMKGSR